MAITPIRWVVSGVPLVLTWSVLVGWSVIRLVERLSQERESLWVADGSCRWLFAIGAHSWFGDECVETIQPGSFAPLNMLQESASGPTQAC